VKTRKPKESTRIVGLWRNERLDHEKETRSTPLVHKALLGSSEHLCVTKKYIWRRVATGVDCLAA
jgi:hypothetical protein